MRAATIAGTTILLFGMMMSGCATPPPLPPLMMTSCVGGVAHQVPLYPSKVVGPNGNVYEGYKYDIGAGKPSAPPPAPVLPAPTVFLGSVRFVFPAGIVVAMPPRSPATDCAAWATYNDQLTAMLKEPHFAALNRERIFVSMSLASTPGNEDPGGSDFMLWPADGEWHLRYQLGPIHDFSDADGIDNWVKMVQHLAVTARFGNGPVPTTSPPESAVTSNESIQELLQRAKNAEMPDPLSLRTNFVGGPTGKPWYTFAGHNYYSATDLTAAMTSFLDTAARNIEPVADPLGGKLLIVIPAHPDLSRFLNPVPPIPGTDLAQAYRAYYDAITQGQIEALKNSDMFDQVVVETADKEDVATDASDYVLWHPATRSRRWLYRVAGVNSVGIFAVSVDPVLQGWVEALGDHLRSLRDSSGQAAPNSNPPPIGPIP